jgi:hypothetical protein
MIFMRKICLGALYDINYKLMLRRRIFFGRAVSPGPPGGTGDERGGFAETAGASRGLAKD